MSGEDNIESVTKASLMYKTEFVSILSFSRVLYVVCFLPRKMEPIEGSKTSAFKPQTPGKYPKENILQDGILRKEKEVTLTDIDWNIEEGRNETYDDLHFTIVLLLHTWNNNNNNKNTFQYIKDRKL